MPNGHDLVSGLAGFDAHLGQRGIDVQILVEEEIADDRDPQPAELRENLGQSVVLHVGEGLHGAEAPVAFPETLDQRGGVAVVGDDQVYPFTQV